MIAYRLKARLAAAKTKAAANVETRAEQLKHYPNAAAAYLDQWPLDWRPIARESAKRRYRNASTWNPAYVNESGETWRWLESVIGSGLIVVCDNATSEVNRNTTGYYVDTFAQESQHGVVLATRDAESPRARFFAAINDPNNAGAYNLLWQSFDDISDARAAADAMAERNAENQRGHDSAYQAGQRFAELGEESKTARTAARVILKDRKAATGSPALCAVIREKVQSLLGEIGTARAARARLANGDGENSRDHYRTFWTGDTSLQGAFCDGASLASYPA